MSQENVEVVRRMLQAFYDGDIEAILAECDRGVEREVHSIPGVEPLFLGHDGVRRWWAVEGVEELGYRKGRLDGVKETDDTVIASVCFEGEGRRSGARVQMPVHLVLAFRDGKVARWQVFQTLDQALEAVGLSESE
jgi:ketosteroid isomerase-like protein